MKIINNTYPANIRPIAYPTAQHKYLSNKNSQDVFVKSSPAFKQGPYSRVLNNPILKGFAMGLITDTVIYWVDKASKEEDIAEIPTKEDLVDSTINKIQSMENREEIEKLRNENKEYMAEIKKLQMQIEALSSRISSDNTVDGVKDDEVRIPEQKEDNSEAKTENSQDVQTTLDNVDTETPQENFNVDFPKKKGKLSKQVAKLKDTIAELKFKTEESALKLKAICLAILFKCNYIIEGKDLSNDDIAEKLNSSFVQNKGNEEELVKIIDYYYSALNLDKSDNEDKNTPTVQDNNTAQEASKEIIYKPEGDFKLTGPVVLGTVNLDGKLRKRKPVVSEIDTENRLYNLIIPGTINSAQEGIRVLLKETMKMVKEETGAMHVDMLFKYPITPKFASQKNIEYEMKKQAAKGNPYKHIKEENIVEILDLFSSGKFSNMFCLHSAMRLIDRYVDFNNKDVSVEKQCDIIIKALEQALLESYKIGTVFSPFVTQKENEKTGKLNDFYSSKIYIDTRKLSPEIQKVLGTITIDVTFAKADSRFVNNDTHGIIATIFSEGV